MKLYHGTTLENAKSILEQRVVKGKKASRKHKNRYVSFSKSLLEARIFGEVVLQFEEINEAVPVPYQDKGWASKNPEVYQYLLANTALQLNEDNDLTEIEREKEFVLVNKYRFDHEHVTVHLIGENMKELNKLKKELDLVLKEGDSVKKSVKMYSDFLQNL